MELDDNRGHLKASPSISIVVPAYNAEDVIGTILHSLTGQTSVDFETIVVDDGSDQELTPVLQRFPLSIRTARQENKGAAAARNTGASLAIGRYLAFVDADDSLHREWVFEMTQAMRGFPPIVSCQMSLVDVASGATRLLAAREYGPAFSGLVGLMYPGAYVIRNDVFERIGGFTPGLTYGEHHELGLRLGKALVGPGEQPVMVERPLVTKFHDRSPRRVASYDGARKSGAEFVIETHPDLLRRDSQMLADFHAVAGVASMRLGLKYEARRHFTSALRAGGDRTIKSLARLIVSLVPGLSERVWGRFSPPM